MPYAVFSPCLLNNKPGLSLQGELIHYERLDKLIKKLRLYTVLKFQYYKKAPYDGFKMEIPHYYNNLTLNNLVTVNIYGAIQKMLTDEYVDLDGIPPANLPQDFFLPKTELSDAFCSYLNYLCGKDAVLFIGEENFSVSRPIQLYTDKSFTMNASTYVQIELSDLLLPYLRQCYENDSIFVKMEFCADYNMYVKNKIETEGLSSGDRIALFRQVGDIVASYNGYVQDKYLTKLNSTSSRLRIVYRKTFGKMFYLSIDVESGGFEVFDHKFYHLGQYNFSCELAKPPEPLHHKLIH